MPFLTKQGEMIEVEQQTKYSYTIRTHQHIHHVTVIFFSTLRLLSVRRYRTIIKKSYDVPDDFPQFAFFSEASLIDKFSFWRTKKSGEFYKATERYTYFHQE